MKIKCARKKNGFTLMELMVVIAILGILVGYAVPNILSYIDYAKITADKATVKDLNSVTAVFRLNAPKPDIFDDKSNDDAALMQELVGAGYLTQAVKTQTKGADFSWDFQNQAWQLAFESSLYLVTSEDGVFISNSLGWIKGTYNGTAKVIVVPNSLDGFTAKSVYQDVFSKSTLTAVTFQSGSVITRIHARAFRENLISDVVFPDTLERIDLWAFRDNRLTEIVLPPNLITIEQQAFDNNNITKITIGAKVVNIGTNVFYNNNIGFKDAYSKGGSGTYLFIDGNWVKQ